MIKEIEASQGQVHHGERMTFARLAEIAKTSFYKPAVIVEGRKMQDTVRAHKTAHGQLEVLSLFFGKRLIQQINKEGLQEYRRWRLKIGSRHSTAQAEDKHRPVKLSTINRELSTMRRVMHFALESGWIVRELSFKDAIDMDAERPRVRMLSPAEEVLLLAACQGERDVPYERKRRQNVKLAPGDKEQITAKHTLDNPRLKAAILLALDSGLRRGEILNLDWPQIDFDRSWVKILGTHTKTEQERLAPLSQRTKIELQRIQELDPHGPPFPFSDFKRSWATAKKLAGIEDLHFHDLRRSAITRWIQQGNPLAFAGKAAGHTQLQTTQKHYVAVDEEMIATIAENMNISQARQADILAESDAIN